MLPSFQTPWVNPWRPELVGTLVFVVVAGRVLLIHKKTGHGAGKINGPGGKPEPGETLVQCAVRECQEEVGITVAGLQCRAEMRFVERDGPQWLGFAFLATRFSGEPRSSQEAEPFWCPVDEVPYDRMWPDDQIWLPHVLALGTHEPEVSVSNYLFRDGDLLEYEFVEESSIWHSLYF